MIIFCTIPSERRRHTAMECGLLLVILGVILCIVPGQCIRNVTVKNTNFNFNYAAKSPAPLSTRRNDRCVTEACLNVGQKVLDNINKEVDPCDDFYQFVCGKFIRNTVIPGDKDIVSAFTMINDQVKEQIKKSIEAPIMPGDGKPIRLAKNLYKTCMNTPDIEEQGVNPILEMLESLGGWPVLKGKNWNETGFSWIESACKSREIGHSAAYFLHFGISTDSKNTTRRMITLDQARIGLSREYLVEGKNEKILKAYRKLMMDVAILLGVPPERAEKELDESLEFEKALSNISLPKDARRNATLLHNPMNITELNIRYPSIPWKYYFNRLLAPNITVDDDEIVNVIVPTYLSNFEKLVNKTSPRTQANYFMWRIIFDSISYLNDDFRQREFEFTMSIDGSVKREERWRECTDVVAMSLPLSVGTLFIRKYFNKDAKENAVEMVEDIKNEFTAILKEVDWMDEDTRKSALDKAAAMSSHIAYPDELLDDTKLEEYYEKLELNGSNYLKSMMDLSLFSANYIYNELRKPFNKTDWKRHGRSAIVNAFYGPTENSIQFPAAILQGIFFDNNRPKYMNYGAIGFVIGHEITHGFDDQGRQFDKNGNIVDWWASSTEQKYLNKSQCIIDQYNNYIESKTGLHLNGVSTQGENIADNGGIKTAYLAYQKWVLRNRDEPRLPGVDYTPQQLFWISAASTWCSKYRPEGLKYRINTDIHSPSEFRILGSFSNMVEFAKDFECAEGTKMNPKNKCRVW